MLISMFLRNSHILAHAARLAACLFLFVACNDSDSNKKLDASVSDASSDAQLCSSQELPTGVELTACLMDSDCTRGPSVRVTCEKQCTCPRCAGIPMNVKSAEMLAKSEYDCSSWHPDAGQCFALPCDAPRNVVCLAGTCQEAAGR
jgi:hypothetical protein